MPFVPVYKVRQNLIRPCASKGDFPNKCEMYGKKGKITCASAII